MTDRLLNRVEAGRPDGDDRNDYRAVLNDIKAGRVTQLRQVIQWYAMPNGRYEINSDHAHPDTGVPASRSTSPRRTGPGPSGPDRRRRLYRRYLRTTWA